jgi:predicted flap endonuclease-1-like 5' DNA nuclease
MGIFQAIFGICETKPADPGTWSLDDGKVTVKVNEIPTLQSDGAVYLSGQGLSTPILLVNLGGQYYAYSNRCRHLLGRKIDLVVADKKLRCCSLGHSEYDLDGNVIKGPANQPITKFVVNKKEGDLSISLTESSDETEIAEEKEIERVTRTDIKDIEGIGPVYAEKLSGVGVKTVEQLLEKGANRSGREELEKSTGISHALILEWINMADLFRIKGVGEEYSDLLEEAGVDTVKELAQRNADNLFQKLEEVNTQKKLVRRTPTVDMVKDWIEQAKSLPRVVEY